MNIKQRIMQSLRPRRDGLLLRSDVASFGSPSQVSAAIKTLINDGLIVRLCRGVYVKPDVMARFGQKALLEQAKVKMERQRIQHDKRAWRGHRVARDPIAKYVCQLAKREGISFAPTYADVWAKAVTNLAGDVVNSDEIDDLLVALTRAGKLSARDMTRLVVAHHRNLARV